MVTMQSLNNEQFQERQINAVQNINEYIINLKYLLI